MIAQRICFAGLICFNLLFSSALFAQSYQRVEVSIPPDSSEFDTHRYGQSIAVFNKIMLVGAGEESLDENEEDSLRAAGAVYVLERDPARRWQHVQKIVSPTRARGREFGFRLDMEGNRAIVSEPSHRLTPTKHGVVHLFEKVPNGPWEAVQTLVNSSGTDGDNYGRRSVALHGDRALVSAHGREYGWGNTVIGGNGAAYLYERDSTGNWQEIAFFEIPDSSNHYNQFGYSLDIEGEVALISAPFEDENEQGLNFVEDAGAAYVFEPDSNGVWTLTQKLAAPSQDRIQFQNFGYQVSINQEQLFIGANNTKVNGKSQAGCVYVYEKDSNSVWTLAQRIITSDASTANHFGERLSAKDSLLIVGAPGVHGGNLGPRVGAAYIFKKDSAGQWQEFQKIIDPYGLPHYEMGRNTVDVSGTSAVIAKVDSGVLHYELCESTHEVVKVKGCEPIDYYGHWLDSSGLYLNLELEAGWDCQGLTADVQFDLVEVDTSVIRDDYDLIATAENATFQWGRCGAGSDWTPVPLASDSIFSPIIAGYYAVRVQQDGCELQSNCRFWPPQLPPTSTDAPLSSRLRLYPNPSNGQATLDLSALSQPADLRIYDAQGRRLGRMERLRGSVEVDLREFGSGPGLYVIQVQAGGEVGTLKLVWE